MGYSKYSKGYKLIKLSTNKAFIERCVQFEEEPLAEVEIDPNSPTRPKWAAKTLHAAGQLAGDPNDPRRTRSQFESDLCMKDRMFAEK